MPQPQSRQQSRLNDIQMLQRHIMFKQLQELQRQQQFQELGDARQQNYLNQPSRINKQPSGAQYPPLINGTPIHDASQMFMVNNMNLVQRGASPVVQGFSNGLAFSQAQSQSLGLISQQPDISLYGTPIASAGNNLSQYSHLHGASHDSASEFAKGNNYEAEKPVTQSSALRNSFVRDQCNIPSNQVGMLDGAFLSKQTAEERNLFGQVPTQDLNSEVLSENFQAVSTLQRNASEQEFGRKQEQAGWPGLFPEKTTTIVPSQGVASLDPLEQKILFSMDDNSWEDSFGRRGNMEAGGFDNTLGHTDHLSSFPSVQSGSWSALMQSAVAEASSSDTGLQEEWSGLSFQNPELSTDNQPSNYMTTGKQQTKWVDSKPEVLFKNPHNSSFPGFQQPGIDFSLKQKDGMRSDTSHESIQHSPKSGSKWLDCNPQEKQPTEGGQPVQRHSPLQSSWPGQNYEHSESGARHFHNLAGDSDGTTYKDPVSLWKTDDNHVAGFFPNSVGGLEQVNFGKVSPPVDRENSQLNHFTAIPKSSTTKVDHTIEQETCRRVAESRQLDYMNHVDFSVRGRNMGNDQHQPNTYKGATETYEKRENSFQRENSIDSYHSNASQNTITRHELRENVRLHESDSRTEAEGNQKPSGQVLGQQVPRGLSDHDQGYVGQFKLGTASYSGMELEKGRLPDSQKDFKESEDLPPRSNVESSMAAFFERSSSFHGPNINAQTSQNMLELLHKVDKSTEYRPGMHFGLTDSTSSEVPLAESYAKSSASEGFGLRLAPPSQQLPNSNCFDSSQSSPQMGNSGSIFRSVPYVRNQLQNQQQSAAPVTHQSQQATLPGTGSRFPGFNPVTSEDASHQICTNANDQQFPFFGGKPVAKPSVTSDMSQQAGFSMGLPNVWRNVSTQQNLSSREPQKVPFNMRPSPDSTNSSQDTASMAPQELHSQTYFKGGSNSQTGNLSHGQESVASGTFLTGTNQQGFDRSQTSGNQTPEISARDLEAFGRSLKPSYAPPQNYSLMHQVQSMKNVENDPSKSVAEKYNGVDSDTNVQQVNSIAGQQSFYGQISGVRDLVNSDSHSHSISSNLASNRTDQSQINLQLASSWFKHYGTLKNGQMLSMHDARAAMNAAQQFSLGKPCENLGMNSSMVQMNAAGPSQVTATPSVAVTNLSLPYPLNQNVSDPKLAVIKSKKRKIAPVKLLPWHKEVTQGCQRLQNLSMADLEWAHAANRLIENVEHEAEMIEDALPVLRPKKRLILTTGLMQQLFRPAPAVILSENASSNCDTIVYFSARLALGDACSMTIDSHMPSNISDMSSEKPDPSDERIGDQKFSKTVEDFINRSQKLEDDFLRLDKSASILDTRVESQELERFSVINRFAKFHIRGQVAAAETSTSSSTMPTVPRTFPQRYVTAIPMPSTVPEQGQCISL